MKRNFFENCITIKSKRNHSKEVKRNNSKRRQVAGYQKFLHNAKIYAINNHTANINHKNNTHENPNTIKFINKLAPVKFNLQYENCVAVIRFINELKTVGKKGRHININMENVIEIGNGAISMLLSVIYDLGNNGILVKGTKPKNKEVNAILEKSGFFKYIKTVLSDENSNSKNKILRTGDNKTSATELAEEVRKSMETVWGVNARCPRLYGGIFEMVRNSCDHAFKNSELTTWHLGLTHVDEENKVKFSFVDNGKGIIKTFLSGVLKNFINLFKDNTDILVTAFSDGIESRTKLSWRGKGLPSIYEMREDNIITKLIVITNDVYIDFDEKIHVTLPVSYSGTYYYWEINKSCVKSYFE
jgi:hypothetical protein